MNTHNRLQVLRNLMVDDGLDAMLISSPENRRYFSGFTGSAGYLFITSVESVLATDFRYLEQANLQTMEFRVQRMGPGLVWFTDLVSQAGVKKIGFESHSMSVATYKGLVDAIDESRAANLIRLVDMKERIDKLRATKYDEELVFLKKAIDITDRAFEDISVGIQPGLTEAEVSWRLEKSMRELGAEGLAFDTIVGAGPNGALPHHRADDTVIRSGQPVVIDMGAKYEGYCADLTRTVFVGKPDETFIKVYSIVLSSQLDAENQVRSGMTGSDTDAISRNVISDAGYGENFGHSLGHGVGLAVHEDPKVGPRADNVIEDEMVFTIEPGIYIPGWGGVRIEDIVLMKNGHATVLSQASKLDLGT